MANGTIVCSGILGETQGKSFGVSLDTDSNRWIAAGRSVDLFINDQSGEFNVVVLPENGLQIWNSSMVEQSFFTGMNGTTAVDDTGNGRAAKADDHLEAGQQVGLIRMVNFPPRSIS